MVESVWDYPRPPRVEPTPRRIVIRHAGATVVDTTAARRVLETSHPPVYYVPRGEVTAELIATTRHTFCEFKGTATYWTLIIGGATVPDAAWSYENPSPGYEALTGMLAFYPGKLDECSVDGEVIRPQEGDFYGGWITRDIVGPMKGAPGTRHW